MALRWGRLIEGTRVLALALILGLVTPALARADGDLLVFAAASMKNALDAADAAFAAKTGTKVSASYAASSALAKQIENGAPADVFISADNDWMDELVKHQLIDVASRGVLAGNALVLVAPAASTQSLTIAPGFALADALGAGHLAMADPSSVPAGKYGKAALEKLGVWVLVAPKVASAENVRAALALVARGEAPFGIVYQTDANAEKGVKVVGTFPEDSHAPIVYPLAVVAASKNPAAAAYVAFLKSDEAWPFFEKQGFTKPQ